MIKIIDRIKGIYGSRLNKSREKKHDHLGMDLDLLVDEEVRVKIKYYLKNIVSNFSDTIQGRLATPEAYHLFTVREDTDRKMLDEDRAAKFHHSVAQLLFSTPRISKDIHTYVELLTARVRSPDEYYWRKLQLLLQYIRSTIRMSLILRVDKLNIVKWWLDTSYEMHPYFQNGTGQTMSLGWVSVSSMSKR